jgi:hypothetical protein
MWDISEEGGIAEWTYQWGLQPAGKNDVEVVVDPQGFDTWLPEGGIAASQGGIGVGSSGAVGLMSPGADAEVQVTGQNSLTITAKLQDANGGPPKQKARKITWQLLNVSHEPGLAMNAPKAKMADNPDLEFDEYQNVNVGARVLPNTQAQSAETIKDGMTEAQVIVRANDWGAWGTIKVTAELESGEHVVGYLKGDKAQKEIRLPKRGPDSKVADYWKEQNGVADKADNDDLEMAPEGYYGCPGDGLTLYEEYRGFFQNGAHMRTSPTRKDYFVADRIGTRYSKAGISMFQGATQLETHGEMLLSEFDDNMVVNFNHGQGPHVVDQHGIQMVSRPADDMGGAAITRPGMLGPGTPRIYAWVVMNSSLNPRASEYDAWRYASIVAHELAHTVSVHEHGKGDKQVQWIAWEDDDGVLRVHEMVTRGAGSDGDPVAIVVRREDGTEIPASNPMFNVEGGLSLVMGVRQGQHSGAEACLMRYDNSWAYASTRSGEKNVRYYVQGDEQRGSMLCRTANGTGVNDPAHDPQSRYGPAAAGRGDCVHQICVNDLASPPIR